MKPVPPSALVGWLVVALLIGLGLGGIVGATALSSETEVPVPGPRVTTTQTVSSPSPSPVPETVSLKACMAAQGERLGGWTYRAEERDTLENLLTYLEEGGDPEVADEMLQEVRQGAIDRYNAAADRCFAS